MVKVFLGGTCNNSEWRDKLISMLDSEHVSYFNPVVDDWTSESQAEEIKQRKECDYCLYVITPKMTGVYSIAEAVDDSNKRPEKTIFCYIKEDDGTKFKKGQISSLNAVSKLICDNGANVFTKIEHIANYLILKGMQNY